jgi:predicted nucleic acid-binding protein
VNATCLDTSWLVEITHDGPNAKKCSKALATEKPLVLSTITLHEIAKYTTRVAGRSTTGELLAFLHLHSITPLLAEIATLAATLGTQHKLTMADALIYATARHQNATLWTQDDDLEGLQHVRYFPKIKL